MPKTILIVDDEPRTRQGIKKTLELWAADRFRVECASNGFEAREWLSREPVHLLITDVRMPEISGLDLIESLKDTPGSPLSIVISGYAEFKYVQTALRLGAVNYLLKPIDKQELLNVVVEALQLEEDRHRREKLEKLVDPKLLELDEPKARLSDSVRTAMDYVELHLTEPLSMADVADVLHLNASYFSSLFKEQSGLPFSEYLTRRRVQRAKELLLQTSLPVCEIAEQVGYRTDKYFIKVFKQLEHKSPSRYRHEAKDDSNPIV